LDRLVSNVTQTATTNTLYADINCPKCGKKITTGIGFRAGGIGGDSYKLGDTLLWTGRTYPATPPADGNLKTIGYFECDNLKCASWSDCYPEIQEALITIVNNTIRSVEPTVHKPGELDFDIIEPKE
jgi:hypothetical protein